QVKIHVDLDKCRMLDPDVDIQLITKHLDSFRNICVGDKAGGKLATLEQPERFRWLTAKRSTIIQCSVVHPGLCVSAEETHQELFEKLVLYNPSFFWSNRIFYNTRTLFTAWKNSIGIYINNN